MIIFYGIRPIGTLDAIKVINSLRELGLKRADEIYEEWTVEDYELIGKGGMIVFSFVNDSVDGRLKDESGSLTIEPFTKIIR